MLRITIEDDTERLTFRLEGRLAGNYVEELEHCWANQAATRAGKKVRFDLREVTFVDAVGKAFLAARCAEGVELISSGCSMRALVAELVGRLISPSDKTKTD